MKKKKGNYDYYMHVCCDCSHTWAVKEESVSECPLCHSKNLVDYDKDVRGVCFSRCCTNVSLNMRLMWNSKTKNDESKVNQARKDSK